MNVCQESRNFAINMLPNLEPTAATDQFVTRFLHVGLYTGLQNFLTFVLNLGVGFYSSKGLCSRQYGILWHTVRYVYLLLTQRIHMIWQLYRHLCHHLLRMISTIQKHILSLTLCILQYQLSIVEDISQFVTQGTFWLVHLFILLFVAIDQYCVVQFS